MNSLIVTTAAIAWLYLGYRWYGRFIERTLVKPDDSTPTPARAINDGVDFHPSKTPLLWGNHFASIAGGGSHHRPHPGRVLLRLGMDPGLGLRRLGIHGRGARLPLPHDQCPQRGGAASTTWPSPCSAGRARSWWRSWSTSC